MFVFGHPDTCPEVCEPCADKIEPVEGDERLLLDLKRYRGGIQRVTDPPVEKRSTNACDQLKNITEQFEEIIDSVVQKVNELKNDDLVLTDWSGKKKYIQNYVDRTINVPFEDPEKMGIKPIRYCPVCLNPMSCFPKYSPCPKCCTKAIPQFDAVPTESLTVDEIIDECLKVPKRLAEDFCVDPCAESTQDGATHCTCKGLKFCAHCRIRKMCAKMFNAETSFSKPCPKVEPTENDDFCIIVESDESSPFSCSPYLERVLGQLRDIYKERDEQKTALLNEQSLLRIKEISKNSLMNQNSTFMNRMPHGPKIGHKTCLKQDPNVSRRHGWAWMSTKKARKHGWRPGAICRYAGAIMRFFLQYSAEKNAFNTCRLAEEAEASIQPAILNLRKKNGAIYITLNAVNSPYVEMKPIVFKIVKSDLAVALRAIKNKLKNKGFPKCVCHKSVMMCVCRKAVDKKHLVNALQKECKRRRMESCEDHLILTDTSESEMEFNLDVTPVKPGGKPQLTIKPRTANLSTQTATNDQQAQPMYPTELSPYWRVYDCAAGDRYTGTAFGIPGEAVFEDGVFGLGGGGPHGPSATHGGRIKEKGMRSGGGKGGKGIPGGKKKSSGPSPAIPVRMPKRYTEANKARAQAEKDAIKNEIAKKKQGIDLMQYLMKAGTVPKPWNPNEPKPEVKSKVRTGPVVGVDGLTDAQRKRKALNQVDVPPFERLARLGKGIDPCANQCYSPYANPCTQYKPCSYYC